MRPPRPLPRELRDRAFSVRDAVGRGLSVDRLRGRDLDRPFRGVRIEPNPDDHPDARATIVARCKAYAPRLRRDDRFSHLAATALLGLPLPLGPWSTSAIDVTSLAPLNPVRARGVRGHRSIDARYVLCQGLPASQPLPVFFEVAPALDHVDLVALGDALVLRPRTRTGARLAPLVELGELQSTAAAFRGRGARRARDALASIREGAESPMETRLRLLVLAAGLPEPTINAEICDDDGRFLGYADLGYPDLKLLIEYDGDHHRSDPAQYDRDQTRVQNFFRSGFDVLRVRRRGLLVEPTATIRDIRSAHRRAEMSVSGRTTAVEPRN